MCQGSPRWYQGKALRHQGWPLQDCGIRVLANCTLLRSRLVSSVHTEPRWWYSKCPEVTCTPYERGSSRFDFQRQRSKPVLPLFGAKARFYTKKPKQQRNTTAPSPIN